MKYLPLHALYLDVLRVDLVPHVQRHALQVPDDAAHVSQVLLHLVLAGVVSHSDTEQNKVCLVSCLF